MTNFIVLNNADLFQIIMDRPVTVEIDNIKYVICSEEYYTKENKE